MVITKRTRVKDLIPLIPQNRFQEFIESFPPQPLPKPILSMTCGEFASIILDEQSYIESILKPKAKAYLAFGALKEYSIQMKQIADYLKTMQIKITPDEQAAIRNIEMPSFIERMLLDNVTYFHLKNMEEAEQIPLADYLVVLKDQVASAKYARNLNKIIEQRSKAKRHK